MTDLFVFAAVGVGTLAIRASFLVNPRLEASPRIAVLLEHARPAILAALTVGFLVGSPDGPTAAALIGAGATGVVMRRTHNMLLALTAGMSALALGSLFL